jgi:uncharacterized SAM-binding protein YcdF (DUF218 family)
MLLKIGSRKLRSSGVNHQQLRKRRLLLLSPLVALSLWISYKLMESYLVRPEAIFVLGGHENRERLAAQLAAQNPELPIWVSSGSPRGYVTRIFAKAGINSDRLHLDYHAIDTVTNFTTLVDVLKAHKINSVYLITSESHMGRALLIGEIVFGSRGIVLKPLAVPSQTPQEPLQKCLRDGARAIFWLISGSTGEMLVHPDTQKSQFTNH